MTKDNRTGRGGKKAATAEKAQNQREVENGKNIFDEDDDQSAQSPQSSIDGEPPMKSGRKRSYQEHANDDQEFSSEMQKMLDVFGADITKTLLNKRKRLEQFTQTSLKTSNKKVDEIWKAQQHDRKKLSEEFHRQMTGVFQQWESDLEKSKEQEEKLLNLFKQQQKLFQQTRVVQSQKLKMIRQLHEQYTKSMDELNSCHQEQQNSVQTELKKEMTLLQKKILMDTQQQEMANVRKSLHSMLF